MTIAQFLIALVGPIVARILSTLGLSVVILAGLTGAVSAIKNLVISNIGSMPAAAVGLGGLFGIWECLGIIFGAVTFIVAWKSSAGFWTLAAKG